MAVLEEQGIFWWRSEKLPKGVIAPGASVSGVLKIEDDGLITLELTGQMPGARSTMASLVQETVADIQGILKGSSKRVLLMSVHAGGGQFRTNGLSYARYRAEMCLLSAGELPSGPDRPSFRFLSFEMKGLEEWLCLRSIESDRKKSRLTVKYRKPKDLTYEVEGGKLRVRYDLEGPGFWKYSSMGFSLRELVWLDHILKTPVGLTEIQTLTSLLEDMLILLTGADYSLDWPMIGPRSRATCTFYYRRNRPKPVAPKQHECWTVFPDLENTFGAMFATWKRKREEFGPAFYLYLGTRRGADMYIEHRFVNLVFGMEAFHRKKPAAGENQKLADKIKRILNGVASDRDKKWLANKLKNAGEPSLEQRLNDTLSDLPIKFDKTRLRKFAKQCADRRNEISHFGGQREQHDYQAFMFEIHNLSEALSELYHGLLLREMGAPDVVFERRMQGTARFTLKHIFEAAGLWEKVEPTK